MAVAILVQDPQQRAELSSVLHAGEMNDPVLYLNVHLELTQAGQQL
jgi:hypothetical protein